MIFLANNHIASLGGEKQISKVMSYLSNLYPENIIFISLNLNVLGKEVISIDWKAQPVNRTIIKHKVIRKKNNVFIDD